MKLMTILGAAALLAATVRAENTGPGTTPAPAGATSPDALAGADGKSAAGDGAASRDAPTPEEMESYRAAMRRLDAAVESQSIVSAMEVVRAAFPKSRARRPRITRTPSPRKLSMRTNRSSSKDRSSG